MHTIRVLSKASWPLLLAVLAVLAGGLNQTQAQPLAPTAAPGIQSALTSGFTFHGQLARAGTPYTGVCDFTFSLWDSASGGTQIGGNQAALGVAVSNGVFSTVLNDASQFGAAAFDGNARWLGIQVQCTGDTAASDLGRQALLATPYASSVSASAGNSLISAINDPATTGTINSSRLGSDVILLTPSAPQSSTGDANGTGAMLNLHGVSTCCGPTGVADFKVYQNGGILATSNLGIGTIPIQGAGYRFMYYPYKAAFRVGHAGATEWDDANIGFYSWAGGESAQATAFGTFAFGDHSVASGTDSVSFGSSNKSTGTIGFTVGANNIASGFGSTAIGYNNLAGGQGSVAIGYRVVAAGDYSVALGQRASTASCAATCDINNPPAPIYTGSFVFGDESTTSWFSATANNQFAARAAGGFRFRTNATGTTGCDLPAGSGVFSCSSDRNLKTNFADLDGELVLSRIAAMPVPSWSYRDDPLHNRHIGPMAQDFYGAFGLGENDKTIGLLDIAGVDMAAIKALEKRTGEVKALQAQVAELEAQKTDQQQQFSSLEARLAALEQRSGNGGTVSPAYADGLWFFLGGLLVAGLAVGAQRFLRVKRG